MNSLQKEKTIIGKLLIEEKYKFVNSTLLASVVHDTIVLSEEIDEEERLD